MLNNQSKEHIFSKESTEQCNNREHQTIKLFAIYVQKVKENEKFSQLDFHNNELKHVNWEKENFKHLKEICIKNDVM